MVKKMRAQSLGEYVIMISIVIAFVVAMFPMVKRGTQSLIKSSADQIGNQAGSEQDFNSDSGFLMGSNVSMASDVIKTKIDRPGVIGTIQTEAYDMRSRTFSNLGFTEE